MAWTYHNWAEQTTADGQLSVLRRHITEVAAKLAADVAADGKSVSYGTLQTYLDGLKRDMRALENTTGTGAAASRIAVTHTRRVHAT